MKDEASDFLKVPPLPELVVSPIPVETTELADYFKFSKIIQFIAVAVCYFPAFLGGFLVVLILFERRSFCNLFVQLESAFLLII